MNETIDFAPLLSPPHLAVFFHVLAWLVAAAVALRVLGRVFGPLVLKYAPRLYWPLADLGHALLALLSDVQAASSAARGDARPPGARVTPVAPPPTHENTHGEDGFVELGIALRITSVLFALSVLVALNGCTASQGQSIGQGVNLFSKALDWTCSAWSGARPLVRTLIPDAAADLDASAPAPAGPDPAAPSSGGSAP